MPDQNQIQGLPPGAIVGAPLQQPAPQIEGLPPGAVVGPALQAASAPTSEADAIAQAPNTVQQAQAASVAPLTQARTVGDIAGPATHVMVPGTGIVPIDQQNKGVVAGIKRNTVGAVTGIYHALNDPVTPQESAALLQKIRDYNSSTNVKIGTMPAIPESNAQNPAKAALAYHRIIDAPADVLLKKGKDETEAAKDLLANHEYWKGGNLYLNGLTSRLLSGVPMAGPAVDSIAERAEHGDVSGAATDLAAAVALEHAPAIIKGAGKAVGKVAETVGETASKIPGKVGEVAGKTAEAIKPESLTKRPETVAAQHGTPVNVDSPLDGPTVGKQLGGKDLSSEALKTLQDHVGETIPAGSTAKNMLMKAVEPVTDTIQKTAKQMNKVVQDAPKLTTSVMQDNVFGEGSLTDTIDKMKQNVPPSVRDGLAKDIDAVMEDADKALNSNDPAEVLEYRRQLGKQIDWDKIERNPSTPSEVQNAARAKVYKAIGDKIHSDIPDTVPLDKVLQPNLELKSHMVSKLGERVVNDPLAATAEHQSEFNKGKTTVENAAHNSQVAKNWGRIKTGLVALGIGAGTIHEIEKFLP